MNWVDARGEDATRTLRVRYFPSVVPALMNDPEEIRHAIRTARTVAVVGCSPNPARPSNSVARYLIESGYQVIPVNPGHPEILGQRCYPSLGEIPPEIVVDIVDVFRRPEFVAPVADQAIARGVGFFFMQQGIEDRKSAARLEAAGIPVATDRCLLVERERLVATSAMTSGMGKAGKTLP